MSHRSGLWNVVEAVARLKAQGRPVKVILIGSPDAYSRQIAEKRMAELGIADLFTMTGTLPYTKIPSLLRQAKIGLIPFRDMPKFHRNIACKAFEYMACGIPCICSDLPPQRLIVKENETGLFCPPDAWTPLRRSIRMLLDDMPRAGNGLAGRRRKWKPYGIAISSRRSCRELFAGGSEEIRRGSEYRFNGEYVDDFLRRCSLGYGKSMLQRRNPACDGRSGSGGIQL